MRYFVRFAYMGKAYHGWQRQPNALTVQEVLEDCFSTLLRTPVNLVGAGRTDTGVHAKEMFAHFDMEHRLYPIDFISKINAFLPADIAVSRVFEVEADAHARFSALERTYEYWITQEKDPFATNSAHLVHQPLDVKAMDEAASLLLEHTDFECFSKSRSDVKTFNCDIKQAEWSTREDILVFTIKADRFLRNMVRAIVGTLLEVGTAKRHPNEIHELIKKKNRSEAGVSVPAKGLYLVQIAYPKAIFK